MPTESDARQLAKELAANFLRCGNYVAASNPLGGNLVGAGPVLADGTPCFEDGNPFAGLAVQSVGYESGGDEPKIHIYVSKGSKKSFSSLPETLGAIPIQVNRIGKVTVRPEAAASSTNQPHVYVRNGRVACGSSCAPSGENYSGTLGALVCKTDGTLYAMSNNHVFAACNHTPVDMPILSPSNQDGRPGSRPPGAIAIHSEIVELRSGDPMIVTPCLEDAAIARVLDADLVTSWQGDASGFDTPGVAFAPQSGQRVKKFGRTTGLTVGTVEALINSPTPIPYNSKLFKATVWFSDVWTVRGDAQEFALPGDSGSLVVAEDESCAVGMVFAAASDGSYGIVLPFDRLARLFGGLALVSQHGV